MSPRAAAAAVARSAAATIPAPTRTRTPVRRPAPARRRSGAAARPRTAVRTLPRYDFVTVLDRLLRGPAYIAIVGLLLVGIVFFNVDVLRLNHGIARTDAQAAQLKRENASLTLQLAKLGSSERIQSVAQTQGLVLPQPGDVRYLRAGRNDAERAVRMMTAPNPAGVTAAASTAISQQSQPTAVSATTPAPVTPVTPTTTVTPAPSTTTAAPAATAASGTTATTTP